MKKSILLLFVLTLSLATCQFSVKSVHAQDAPNANVTKRRPDHPANYSPSPSHVGVDPRVDSNVPDIQQVQISSPSFFVRLWLSLKSFFANFFSSPISTSTPVASANSTVDWKTFPDSKIIGLPYQFKYPNSVEILEAGDFVYLKIGSSEIRHRFVAKTKNISSLMDSYQPFASPKIIFSSKTPITVGQLSGYQATTTDGVDTYLFLGNDLVNGIFVFSYPSTNIELKSILNQILSTFRFTN